MINFHNSTVIFLVDLTQLLCMRSHASKNCAQWVPRISLVRKYQPNKLLWRYCWSTSVWLRETALSFFGSCLFACLNTWIDWQILPKTMVDWFVNNSFTIWACTICSDIIRWYPFLVHRNKLSLFSTHPKSLYYIRCLIIKMREIKLRCLPTCVLWWKKSNNM